MNNLKSQRLSELAALLYAEADQESDRYKMIARTIKICDGNPPRWWDQIGADYDAEGLIAYFTPRMPRRLPPVPYEELPS